MSPVTGGPAAPHPPEDYREWLLCFDGIRKNPGDLSLLGRMREGSLPPLSGNLLDSFMTRLDETVRTLISSRKDRFLRDLEEALETGDLDSAEICAIRFCSDTGACFFFEKLSFLPEKERAALSDGYDSQLRSFWERLLDTVERDADEQGSIALEDLAYIYRRLTGAWNANGKRNE